MQMSAKELKIQTFSKDVWRYIGEHLTKTDLIAVQLADRRLAIMLDNVPEIWHGKHLQHYRLWHQQRYQRKKLSDRDQNIKHQIDELRQSECENQSHLHYKHPEQTPNCEKYRLFAPYQLTVSTDYPKFTYHQDTIHPEGECTVCDYSHHQGRTIDYRECQVCFAQE